MKLQLPQITIGIATCTFASLVSASPVYGIGSVSAIRRGLLEWGVGHYGGTVSEISKEAAAEEETQLESVLIISAASELDAADSSDPTITATPTAEIPVATEEPTTWSTTTLTVTATVTATSTETIVAKAKREEVLVSDDGVATEADDDVDGLVAELNQFFKMDAIALGDPCTPVAEIDYKICVGDAISVCGVESWAWEVDTGCASSGLVCGAIKVPDTVNGGFKGDIKCLKEDEIVIGQRV